MAEARLLVATSAGTLAPMGSSLGTLAPAGGMLQRAQREHFRQRGAI